ncbi:hypothetical protein AOLI_G00104880 [Acnodon oligacanthus]
MKQHSTAKLGSGAQLEPSKRDGMLSLALEEKALRVLVNLPTEQHNELTALTMALQQWFGKALAVQSVRKPLQDEWKLEVERISILAAGLSTMVR